MSDHTEQMPSVRVTRKRLILSLIFVVVIVAFLYFGLPKLAGLDSSFKRLAHGNVWWLVGAGFLECLSFFSYVALFRAVFVSRTSRVNWKASYQITMAGLVATRVFATAGAGGIALTAWALRRSGMEPRIVATRMVAFMALLYGVYMGTLLFGGLGLYLQLWSGESPFAITMIPAILGFVVITLFLLMSLVPGDFDRIVQRRVQKHGLSGKLSRRLATLPAGAAQGIRTAVALLRTRDPGLLGALGWWGFDIATLWACFHAFGYSPPDGVIIMAYFVGWLANTLPIPGGIGGVEGGMIGAFTAFGVGVDAAVVAVLAYRAFSFWLPIPPGAVAYFQLRKTVNRWREEDEPQTTAEPGPPTASDAPTYTY